MRRSRQEKKGCCYVFPMLPLRSYGNDVYSTNYSTNLRL